MPLPASGVRGGPIAMLIDAARSLPPSGALRGELDAAEELLRDSDASELVSVTKRLRSDVADAIRSGKVEAAQLRASFAALEAAIATQLERESRAAAVLHGALPPAQRAAIASAVRELAKVVWASGKRGPGWLERATADLDTAQRESARAIFPDEATLDGRSAKQVDVVLAAFEAESFDPSAILERVVDLDETARARRVALLAKLVTTLTVEQRDVLAARLERRGK